LKKQRFTFSLRSDCLAEVLAAGLAVSLALSQSACIFGKNNVRQDDSYGSGRDSQLSSTNVPQMDPPVRRIYKGPGRVTKEDFIDQNPDEGSLWANNGQTNYYFTKNKIRNPGDIVSLSIETDLFKEIGSEIRRTLGKKEKDIEVETLRDSYKTKYALEFAKLKGDGKPEIKNETKPEVPQEANSNANDKKNPPIKMALPIPNPKTEDEAQRILQRISLKDVDLYPELDYKVGDKMMGEIIERYPNGNYKVRVVRRIPYARGPQRIVAITGVIRGSDIDDDTDGISSGKLYEYRIEVSR